MGGTVFEFLNGHWQLTQLYIFCEMMWNDLSDLESISNVYPQNHERLKITSNTQASAPRNITFKWYIIILFTSIIYPNFQQEKVTKNCTSS